MKFRTKPVKYLVDLEDKQNIYKNYYAYKKILIKNKDYTNLRLDVVKIYHICG